MTTGEARVLVAGEALVDVTRRPDRTEWAHPGGSPLNVAVGMARLGVNVSLAAQVGDDDYGELLRDHVDASDVDLRSLPPHHPDSAVAVATLDADGVATYAFDLVWDPVEMPDPHDFGLVHVGSIGTALLPGADVVERLVADAGAAGVPVSFDPNVRLAITPDVDDVRARVERVAAASAFVKLSDADALDLRPDLDPLDYARSLVGSDATGPRFVAVTRGGDGAVLLGPDGLVVDVPSPPTTLADTIGAGDSFMAALLAGLVVRGWLDRPRFDADALTWLGTLATTAASITCSRPGADPPWRRELAVLDDATA